MPNLINIQEAVNNFKTLIEDAILKGGEEAKHAIIRSSRPILNLHEAVKSELVIAGVAQDFIFPPLRTHHNHSLGQGWCRFLLVVFR